MSGLVLEVNNHLRGLYNQIEPEKDKRKSVKKPNTENSTCTLLVCKRQNKIKLYFDDPHQQGLERLTEEKTYLDEHLWLSSWKEGKLYPRRKRVKV